MSSRDAAAAGAATPAAVVAAAAASPATATAVAAPLRDVLCPHQPAFRPLELQGKEPSYRNMEALLRCTLPWSAHNTSSSSSGRGGAERAARSEAGRLAEGRRRREEWSADDEEALAVVAAKHELQAIRWAAGGEFDAHALAVVVQARRLHWDM